MSMSFPGKVLACVVLLAPIPACIARVSDSGPPETVREGIARDIRAEIASGRLTGVSIALVRHGHILWEQGFGWADREAGRKVTPHTPFSIASTSKTFTTAAMMTLVKAGKIGLDRPANDYLGAHKIVDDKGPTSAATVRMLASHTSGLPTFFLMYDQGAKVQPASADLLLRDYGHVVAAPGTHYEYSNLGMTVLDDIVARRSHEDFGAYLRTQVFQPLGMKDSFFSTDAHRPETYATRYGDNGDHVPRYLTATPGSGGVYASAHDLARWAMFHLKDHRRDMAPILSDREIDALHRPEVESGPGWSYGMGWEIWEGSGIHALSHGGGQTGVRSEFVLVPGEDVACIVLSNRHNDADFIDAVRDRLLATVVPGWKGMSRETTAPVPLKNAGDYAGRWRGSLTAQGHAVPVVLSITPNGEGRFMLEGAPASDVSDLGMLDGRLVGDTTATIPAPDAAREHLHKIALDMQRDGDRMIGEAAAWRKTADRMAIVPFYIELHHQDPGAPVTAP